MHAWAFRSPSVLTPRSETFSYTFPSLFLTLTHRSSQKRLHERRGRNATAEPLTVSSTTAINSPLTSFTVSVTTPHQQPPEPAPSRGYHTTTIHSVMNTSSGRLHPPTSASSLTRSALPEGGEGGRGGRGGVEEGGGGISLGSASAQFTSDSLGALNRIQESLPENVQPWFWQGLWFAFTVLILGLIIRFSPTILAFLEFIALSIKGLGPWGPLVLMFALFATSFPPIIGYSSCVTMSGYVYGFMNGFLMAFSSAWLGSIVCFYFCRRWFKVHVRKLMTKNKSLKAVVRTVEKKGFRLLLLIRLAPYPFNIMNALLSATHIPLYTFALATGLSLLKLMLFVYIGSTLSSLAGNDGNDDDTPKNPDEVHGHKLQKVAMILGIILGIGVGGYVWLIASREVEKSEA
ncbi:MAG: snare associated Golgi protein-domain-containing protein, partial [Benniella sp.]